MPVDIVRPMDFLEHNREVKAVWDSFYKGEPIRIPMILGLSSRYFMFNKDVNPKNISYKEYTEDPDIMFEYQVMFECYRRLNIPADYEMGLPEDGWTVTVDFQNYYDAAWLGAGVRYIENNVPGLEPLLNESNKNLLFERGIPNAFGGLMERGRNYYEYFVEKAKKFSYKSKKVYNIVPSYLTTDGPFTVACDLRGTTEFCLDLYEDPEYAHKLLDFITEATIYRIKEWRKYLGIPEVGDSMFFADDSILLLSTDMYREFVLPYHKKLCNALANNMKRNVIHLCGDATRHFKTIRDELNVGEFDTGFPVSHGALVKELGPDVRVNGGPHIEFLRTGNEDDIEKEVKRILDGVKEHTKSFVLREGNNLAPYTPLKNIWAMYHACKKYGSF